MVRLVTASFARPPRRTGRARTVGGVEQGSEGRSDRHGFLGRSLEVENHFEERGGRVCAHAHCTVISPAMAWTAGRKSRPPRSNTHPETHPLGQSFGPHQFPSKAEQPQNFQGGQGGRKLARSRLGNIEPLLHRQGLRRRVFAEQFGEVFHRQLFLFSSNDLHNMISGDGRSVFLAGGYV